MTIDPAAALRRLKPEKRTRQLKASAPKDLATIAELGDVDTVLADTNVYINDAANRLPAHIQALLGRTLMFHCAVCIGELTIGIANGDPRHPAWRATRDHYVELIANMPATRIHTPDARIWTEAGIIAGTLARTQGLQPHQRNECLNDALIFLTGARAGLPVLTSNRDEFDLIQQLAPEGRFIAY